MTHEGGMSCEIQLGGPLQRPPFWKHASLIGPVCVSGASRDPYASEPATLRGHVSRASSLPSAVQQADLHRVCRRATVRKTARSTHAHDKRKNNQATAGRARHAGYRLHTPTCEGAPNHDVHIFRAFAISPAVSYTAPRTHTYSQPTRHAG